MGQREKKKRKQKQKKSIWSVCVMTVILNRINNKYSSRAYSPSIDRQKWKECN